MSTEEIIKTVTGVDTNKERIDAIERKVLESLLAKLKQRSNSN